MRRKLRHCAGGATNKPAVTAQILRKPTQRRSVQIGIVAGAEAMASTRPPLAVNA